MRTTTTKSTVVKYQQIQFGKQHGSYENSEQVYVITTHSVLCSYLIAQSAENNDLGKMSDLLSLIKHVHCGMMSIKSDIKLDQNLIKIVKAYWPNILFYNIEYGLYVARDVTELYCHSR